MTYAYTNAEIRSILNGLGFKQRGTNEFHFPISSNNSPLNDVMTVEAVRRFQTYFNLTVDGIVGPQTKAMAEKAMYVIQHELDLVVKPNPPLRSQNTPLYEVEVALAVGDFRERYGFEPDENPDSDRVADLPVRRKLKELTSPQKVVA
jgi:hypothetical protein